MVEKADTYQWSSWPEYTGEMPSALGLCATNVVTKRLSFDYLRELIETPLSDNVQILDIEDCPHITTGDHEIHQLLEGTYGISEPLKVQELNKEKRNEILLAALELGAGLRQLSRLTGVTYGVIHRLSHTR